MKKTKATQWLKQDPTVLACILYIQKALESNTLIVDDHLALPGFGIVGNFILFFELSWFCQTLFNVRTRLLSSEKYGFLKEFILRRCGVCVYIYIYVHTHTHTHTHTHNGILLSHKKE